MMNENLFSYGTLQQEKVQLETFGRRLQGQPGILTGFKISLIKIDNEAVIAASGLTHHPIISQTGDANDKVEGTVFSITTAELHQADEYEVADYKRIAVKLSSGITAWVFVSS